MLTLAAGSGLATATQLAASTWVAVVAALTLAACTGVVVISLHVLKKRH